LVQLDQQIETTLAKLPRLTDKQAFILKNRKRYSILRTGRRFGKTTLARHIILLEAILERGNYLWLLPTYRQAEELAFRSLLEVGQEDWDSSLQRLRIILPNGSYIYTAGSDNYDSFRGLDLSGAIFDEYRNILPITWTQVVRPALAKSRGWALFASTPNGYDHFWKLCKDASDKPDEWAHFHYTTFDNPLISGEEINSLKDDLSEQEYKQEVLAEFTKNDGFVFRNLINVCVLDHIDTPENHRGHRLVAGVDLAQSNDFTVFTGICIDCGKTIYWDRFNQVEFSFQRDRIIEAHQKFQFSEILVELNSIGKPNFELLYQAGLPVTGWTTTGQNKGQLIRKLVTVLEQGKLLVPRGYLGELQAYEAKINRETGHTRYQGAKGSNDDRVMSLALANWAASGNTQMGFILI